MRSPHEALGHFALESAVDELADATGVDPVALRLVNDTEIDPLRAGVRSRPAPCANA
jgi:xanthine dehydrogenase YagR molybdenum-binding subunit